MSATVMWAMSVLLVISLAAPALSQARCSSDKDCDIPRARCDLVRSGRCRCLPGFVSWLEGCLPQRRLGDSCDVSPQCRSTEEHAICEPEVQECRCRDGFIREGNTCRFQYKVTTTEPPVYDDDDDESNNELAAILGMKTKAQKDEEAHQHHLSFLRGLAVATTLTLLTLIVFTTAALVSRHVRQRECQEQQAAPLPEKYLPHTDAPPPYTLPLREIAEEGEPPKSADSA